MDVPRFEEKSKAADNKLFKDVQTNTNHVLHKLLPPKSIELQHCIHDGDGMIDSCLAAVHNL
jgi:hypothetical protein